MFKFIKSNSMVHWFPKAYLYMPQQDLRVLDNCHVDDQLVGPWPWSMTSDQGHDILSGHEQYQCQLCVHVSWREKLKLYRARNLHIMDICSCRTVVFWSEKKLEGWTHCHPFNFFSDQRTTVLQIGHLQRVYFYRINLFKNFIKCSIIIKYIICVSKTVNVIYTPLIKAQLRLPYTCFLCNTG